MKKTAKILSVIIAMVLLVGCLSLTAFAETATKTHTYELYQIFTGDFSEEVLSNIKWGANGKLPADTKAGDTVSTDVLAELKKVSDESEYSDSQQLAVITQYADLTTTPYKGESDQPVKDTDSNGYTYSNVTPGYYLIKDKDGTQSGDNASEGLYTLYVVKSTGGTLFFEPKGSVPTVTKKVYEGAEGATGGWYDANSASIGEDVKYEMTGTVSSRIDQFATYYYKFTDTLSKGLTYTTGSLKVYLVNGTSKEDVTTYFWVNATTYSATNGTTITVAIPDLKALTNVKEGDAAKYTVSSTSTVVVEYTAVLNENALVKDPNTNEVTVTYSNDPNNSGTPSTETPGTPGEEPQPDPKQPTGETVKSKTETYTTAIVITKVNASDTILTGAEFTLTGNGVKQVLVTELAFKKDADGTYYLLKDGTYTTTAPDETTADSYDNTDTYKKTTNVVLKGESQGETTVVGEVDENGVVVFTGLGAGDYKLTESKTPAGYNTISPIEFTISFNETAKTFSSTYNAFVYQTEGANAGKFTAKIINQPGSSLPSTGGIGTTIFYVVGSLMVVCAAALLIARKRVKREED